MSVFEKIKQSVFGDAERPEEGVFEGNKTIGTKVDEATGKVQESARDVRDKTQQWNQEVKDKADDISKKTKDSGSYLKEKWEETKGFFSDYVVPSSEYRSRDQPEQEYDFGTWFGPLQRERARETLKVSDTLKNAIHRDWHDAKEVAQEKAEELKSKAEAPIESAKKKSTDALRKSKEMAERSEKKVSEKAKEAKEKLEETEKDVKDYSWYSWEKAKGKGTDYASGAKEGVKGVIHTAAEKVEGMTSEKGLISPLIHSASQKVEGITEPNDLKSQLEERTKEMKNEMEDAKEDIYLKPIERDL